MSIELKFYATNGGTSKIEMLASRDDYLNRLIQLVHKDITEGGGFFSRSISSSQVIRSWNLRDVVVISVSGIKSTPQGESSKKNTMINVLCRDGQTTLSFALNPVEDDIAPIYDRMKDAQQSGTFFHIEDKGGDSALLLFPHNYYTFDMYKV